eukprot:848816_1
MMCSTLIMKSRALVILGLLVVGTHCKPSQYFELLVARLGHLHKEVLASPNDTLKFARFSDHVSRIELDPEFILLSQQDKMVVTKARKYVDDTQDMCIHIAAVVKKIDVALVVMIILIYLVFLRPVLSILVHLVPWLNTAAAWQLIRVYSCLWYILLLVRVFVWTRMC